MSSQDLPFNVNYVSALKGITEQETGQETAYYGAIHHISEEELYSGQRAQLEEDILNELRTWLEGDFVEGGQPVPNGTVERYEVIDIETGDLLIMHRIPYQGDEEEEEMVTAQEPPMMESEGDIPDTTIEPPEELFKVLAGYLTILSGAGTEAAQHYAQELFEHSEKLLAQAGKES